MGGRLDATNVIDHPLVTVITHIGLDHTEYLGDTREKIAGEKAGIIKKGVPVVFWEQEEEVNRVIVEKAREMSSEVIPVSEKQVVLFKFKNKTVDFSMSSEYYEYIRASLPTAAVYQKENAALAIRAIEVLGRTVPPYQAAGGNRAFQGKMGRPDGRGPAGGFILTALIMKMGYRHFWTASVKTDAAGKDIFCFPSFPISGRKT